MSVETRPPSSAVKPESARRFEVAQRLAIPSIGFVGALALYLGTLAPTVTLVDSGELIAAAHGLGVAHPPGFPLYVMLAHLVSLIPICSIAQRVNFASALFAAAAVSVLTLALGDALRTPVVRRSRKSSKRTRGKQKSANVAEAKQPQTPIDSREIAVAMAAAALLFACGRTLWSYATIAEVYTLNTFLISAMVWCMLRWRRLVLARRAAGEIVSRDGWLNAAALVFGLGLGVHHVTVGLMLPAFAVLVLSVEGPKFFASRRLLIAGGFSLAGLCVYAYLPIAASHSPLMNWGDPQTWDRFWDHVTGRQYRVFFQAQPELLGRQLSQFFTLALREYGPPWLPLVPLLSAFGVFDLYRRDRGLLWFIAAGCLANLAYNVNYEIAEDKDAYYLPIFLFMSFTAILGARIAPRLIEQAVRRWNPRGFNATARATICLVLLVAPPICAAAANFGYNNRRNYFIASDYVSNILSTVGSGGMLLTLDWQVYSPMFYLREIENLRSDVTVIDVNQLRRSWYFDYLNHAYPDLMSGVRSEADAFLTELRHWDTDPGLYERDVTLNKRISEGYKNLITAMVNFGMQQGQVYVTSDIATYREGPDRDWTQQLSQRYQLVPEGLVFQLFNDNSFHEPASPRLAVRGLIDGTLKFAEDDVVRVKVLPVYTGMMYNRGRYLAGAGFHDQAIAAFEQALSFDSDFAPAKRAIAESQLAIRQGPSSTRR